MKRLHLLIILLLFLAVGHIACQSDHRITDQHRQILEQEDD